MAPILPETQKIIDKWGDPDSKFIFGYLKDGLTPSEVRIICQNVTRLINRHMGTIAKDVGLPNVSTYTARHSYASNLLKNKASVEFISEALGHGDVRTTKAYLDGFDSDTRREMNQTLTAE
jgi:site-specific recombinase XerD